jgi:sulfite dehydrogenase (quinone) subunit SoeC
MQPVRELPNTVKPAHGLDNSLDRRRKYWRAESVAPLWRILAASGYGLWAWLGLALMLGLYPAGRNGTLLPLGVGTMLVGIGLLVACLPWRGASGWYGWHPRRDSRPNRAALLALVTFLPMLAVAGLVRGDNIFWATRLAGAMLALCSVASLAYTGYRFRRQLSPTLQRAAVALPLSRLVFAGYAGGLWLWLCTLAQGDLVAPRSLYPWVLLLLTLALLLGLLEGQGWHSLGKLGPQESAAEQALQPARFVAALFIYVLPCIALLQARQNGVDLIAAALAVPSCLLGKWLERHLYESLLRGAVS